MSAPGERGRNHDYSYVPPPPAISKPEHFHCSKERSKFKQIAKAIDLAAVKPEPKESLDLRQELWCVNIWLWEAEQRDKKPEFMCCKLPYSAALRKRIASILIESGYTVTFHDEVDAKYGLTVHIPSSSRVLS